MKKQNIIINEKATIEGTGIHTNGNCKPVICLETFEAFTSVTDAAEKAGVHISVLSNNLVGKYKSVKGKHYCYLADLPQHLNFVAANIQVNAEKAKAYDEIQKAEKEEEKMMADYNKLVATETSIAREIADLNAKRNRLADELNNVVNQRLAVKKMLWDKFGREV